mgnify:CR=1 FL=1
MKKITFEQLCNTSGEWKKAVIVFSQDSFNKEFSETARSYRILSDAKYFNADCIGSSLFGDCLDGTDNGVRLDWYMKRLPEEGKRWIIEYCYIVE